MIYERGHTSSTNWGVYGSYYGYHWGPIYDSMTAYSTRQGTLGIELINAKTKDLAWRMFASAKLHHTDPDKIWKIADDNIKNAFNGYPPSPRRRRQKFLSTLVICDECLSCHAHDTS